MNQPTLLSKLLSPAGFGLVLLLFLFPFAAVSCGPDPATRVTAVFTGIDMINAGAPDISGAGVDPGEADDLVALFADQYDIEPLAILSAVAVLGAMATALIRPVLIRHTAATGLAALGLGLLIAAEVRAIARLENVKTADLPTNGIPRALNVTASPRYGFFLAAATLLVLGTGHAIALVRARRSGAGMGPVGAGPPEYDDDILFDDPTVWRRPEDD